MRPFGMLLVISALIVSMISCSEDDATAPDSEAFGMDDAVALVVDSILPDQVGPNQQFRCIRMASSIPEGSVIAPYAPQAFPGSGPGRAAARALEASERSFFFLLDLAPATMYEHDVKYILVGESGAYEVETARWWPLIDGQTPAQFLAAEPDEDFIIAKDFALFIDAGQLPSYVFGTLARQYKEGFVVVQGLMTTEALYSDASDTYDNGIAFFTAYKGAEDYVEGLAEGAADEVLDVIDDLAALDVDVITVYIIAHGGNDSVSLGGYSFTAAQFVSKINDCPDIMFNFLIGSCHSGSFIGNFAPLANVRVVLSACASDEGAKPDWDEAAGLIDYNTEDIGSEWTSSVLRAADIILDSPTAWTEILTLADIEGVPPTCMLLYQAGWAALGEDDLGSFDNLDLSNRTGHTTPGFYCSW